MAYIAKSTEKRKIIMFKLNNIFSHNGVSVRIFNVNGKNYMPVQDLGLLCGLKEYTAFGRKFQNGERYYGEHLIDLNNILSKDECNTYVSNYLAAGTKYLYMLDREGCLHYINKKARNCTGGMMDRDLTGAAESIDKAFLSVANLKLDDAVVHGLGGLPEIERNDEPIECEECMLVSDSIPKFNGVLNETTVGDYVYANSTNANAKALAEYLCHAKKNVKNRIGTLMEARAVYNNIIKKRMKIGEVCDGFYEGYVKLCGDIIRDLNCLNGGYKKKFDEVYSIMNPDQKKEYSKLVSEGMEPKGKIVHKPLANTPKRSIKKSLDNNLSEYELWLKTFKEYRNKLAPTVKEMEEVCNRYYNKYFWVVLPSADECKKLGYKNKFEYAYKNFRDNTKQMLQAMHDDINKKE